MPEVRAYLSDSGKAIVECFDSVPKSVGDVFAGRSNEILCSMYARFIGGTGDEHFRYLIATNPSFQDSQSVDHNTKERLFYQGELYHLQPGLEHSLQLPVDEPSHTATRPSIEEHLLIDVYYRVDGAYVAVTQAPDSTYHIHVGEKNSPMTDVIEVQAVGPDMRDGSPIVFTTARGRLIPSERSATWGQPGKYTTLTRLLSSDYRLVVRSGKFILEWI